MRRSVLAVLMICICTSAYGQKKSLEEVVKSSITSFSNDGALSENGYHYFDSLFSNNHYVILGEYHGSTVIGELTNHLLPIYRKNGGNLLGLEISPVASEIVSNGIADEAPVDFFRNLNTRYLISSDKRQYTPIPFFKNSVDAEFIATAKKNNLNLIGLDQDYLYSYLMLLDKLYEGLDEQKKREINGVYTSLKDTIEHYVKLDIDHQNGKGGKENMLARTFGNSEFVNNSLTRITKLGKREADVINALRRSNDIYYANSIGDWWSSNNKRTSNFINNFSTRFVKDGVISDEKLFLKIGGLHAAKGMNGYNNYDIGNCIYETARLTQRETCHIIVLDRFWLNDNGSVEDMMADSTSWYATNFGPFLQHGTADEWTIIDLERIRKYGLYSDNVNDRLREYFERYDIVLLAPVDRSPVLNIRE